MSLTWRLIVTLTAGAAVVWALASLGTVTVLSMRLDEALDGGLRETAERLLPLVFEGGGDDADEALEAPHFDERPGEYVVYQVRRGDGTLMMRSHDAPQEAFQTPLAEGFSTVAPWRVFTLGSPDRQVWVQVAEDLGHRSASLKDSALALLLPLGLLVPLSALGIFAAVQRGLRPVRRLKDEIESRRASNLDPVDDAHLPDELRPVAVAVNGLIGRLKSAMEAERSFAANSAHELRTPLAASLALVQRLVAELDGQEPQARARQVEASLSRLRHLSEKLLQLSRADAGLWQVAEEIDLMPAVRVLVEEAARRGTGGRQVLLDDSGVRALRAPMDIDAFGIALRNLIENALVHGADDVVVRVGDHEVSVSNGGAVVPGEVLARLTMRFKRGDTQREGSGLGLAIAETIMLQAGGSLVLASPVPGRTDGFEARMILPGG